jgi:hypothetical protein
VEKHKCGAGQGVVMENDYLERVDWARRVSALMKLYRQLGVKEKKVKTKKVKRGKSKAKKKATRKKK